jgi:diguanylate cyclase (GGDEF)-like protein
MKIQDLPLNESCVDIHLSVREVAKLFERCPDWPGVILTAQGQFVGMLSRNCCFEVLGKPFGIEIFAKATILAFFKQYGTGGLLLDGNTSVKEAVKVALTRNRSLIYDPIVVHQGDGRYALLNMQVLLLALCDQLENLYSEFHALSFKDPLTNLSNRRGFFQAAQPEIAASQATQSDLSALMIDIDDFKLVNDIYGHFVGDCVLQAVAAECQKALRQTDLLGRFGGEEFIALLPGTAQEIAFLVAERLRSKIETLIVFTNGFQVSVTVSVGVCHIKDAYGSLDTLLTQADQAMYAAKAEGRNQVMIWDAELALRVRKDQFSPNSSSANWWRVRVDAARIYDETIEGWAKALELRDKESKGHAQRVTRMTLELATKVGVAEKDLVDIRRGALLHDIGKIAVPDNILFKPGALTEEEWEVMRKHPTYAFELLSPVTYLQKCADIPYCHHEHWDGSGYPRGLAGEEIPLAARIFTIIDVWDALSTNRCYRAAWQPEAVKQYIAEQSGKLFDPGIVNIFLEMPEDLFLFEQYGFSR